MNGKVLVEGMIFFALGMISIAYGIKLNTMEKVQLYDVLGPGNYNLGLGLAVILVGVIYVISHYKGDGKKEGLKPSKTVGMRKMVSMVITFSAYILLLNLVGFLAATILFLLAMFRVVGFRSWPTIGGLSVGISLCYYVIFVRWLGMIFPEGLLFR